MNTPYQVMPDLAPDEYAALKADIQKRGVQLPILVDEDGNILDGHHRQRIAEELGIECPHALKAGLSHAEKTELAVALNIQRRHLTRDQKRELVEKYLKAAPEKSDRQIAAATGVSDKTVGAVRKAKETTAEIPQLKKRTGKDGKARTAPTPQRKAAARQIRKEAEASRAKVEAAKAVARLERLSDEQVLHWFADLDEQPALDFVATLLRSLEECGVEHGYTLATPAAAPKPKATRKRTPKPKVEPAAIAAPTDFDELVKSRPAPEVYRTVYGRAPPSSMTDTDMLSAAVARCAESEVRV